MRKTSIGVVDDHTVLRVGLVGLLKTLDYDIVFDCSNGLETIQNLHVGKLPDIILLDINMPEMDGFETTIWLRDNFPEISVLVLSMHDDESAIIKMIRNGAKGYVTKDVEPRELKKAIEDIKNKGVHYSELVSGRLFNSIHKLESNNHSDLNQLQLTEREREFLILNCSEMTYKEIADKMKLSPRTIDGYRDSLFSRLNIKNRVGLVLFAIKNNLLKIN